LAPLTEAQLLRFLIEIAALLLVSRVLAEVAKRFDQAPVIGELLAGILLGKSVLGHLAPAAYAYLFTADPLAMHLLESIAWLGLGREERAGGLLSSFAQELVTLKEILAGGTARLLLLADEFARTTGPREGRALGMQRDRAVLEHLGARLQ